jgi:hypothetical protein
MLSVTNESSASVTPSFSQMNWMRLFMMLSCKGLNLQRKNISSVADGAGDGWDR